MFSADISGLQLCPALELRKFAKISREALISSIGSSGDPELDEGLMRATQKEISKGFLVGPVKAEDLPDTATLTGDSLYASGTKYGPSMTTKHQWSMHRSLRRRESPCIQLTTSRLWSGLWMRCASTEGKTANLTAKCWDLSDAYKQLPLSEHAFNHDAFLIPL